NFTYNPNDTIKITFTNDAWGGSAETDRNILLSHLYLKLVPTNPDPPDNPDNPNPSAIVMPIEVLGVSSDDTQTVKFQLSDANVDTLFLRCHRCSYRDSSVNTERGAKGSVRLNGGTWINLDDKTASVSEPEKSYGGIAGGFHTVRFTVPVSGAKTGENTLEFRFNGTDGFTSGYRILAFNLRKGQSGSNVLAAEQFTAENTAAWQPPLNTQADIAAGKSLWETKVLNESPLASKQLKATCSGCHAADGRDLKYFNYSNWSIEARSMFHGLTEQEGKQIASYIRSLKTPAPAQARPWNPPYQPGPGLDSKPVEEWAAGAGVDAVLQSDKDMLPHLFPNGTSQEAINKAADMKGTLNIRELPVALQLPDWNDWLPHVHPLDIWGDAFANSDVPKAYNELTQKLASNSQGMVQDKSVITEIQRWMDRSWAAGFSEMGGAIPCQTYDEAKAAGTTRPSLMDQLPSGKTCEDALNSLNPWLAVKNWEMFQTYGLEDDTATLYPYGEKRGWFGNERNVFEVAAHRSADNSQNFRYQSHDLGSYHSNVWYHVQMILNAGNRDPYTWFPQDWFYTPMFIAINSRDNNQPLALLNTAMHIKMYQNLDMTGTDGKGVDRGADYDGWWLPFVTPWRFESTIGWEGNAKGFPWTQLNDYEGGLRVKVTNALLREFLDKQKSYPISSLKRRDATVTDSAYFEAADYVLPSDAATEVSNCYYGCPGEPGQAVYIYRSLIRFKEMGVDANLRGELIDYMKELFPNNDWEGLR
ncbi:MAG: hypothetical protein ACRCYY_10100, partial [Trueperaceae bacterium]